MAGQCSSAPGADRHPLTPIRDDFTRRLSATSLRDAVSPGRRLRRRLPPRRHARGQSSARWEWHGRITVTQDPRLTLTRPAIDTGHGGGDVGLGRYDFNTAEGEGDEDSLTLAL